MRRSAGAKRGLAVVLLSALILASLLSVAFVAIHADHHCDGEHRGPCAVCAQLCAAGRLLRQIAAAPLALALCLGLCAALLLLRCADCVAGYSPVSLKIRLNN